MTAHAVEIASQRTLSIDDEGLAGRLYVPEDAASARKVLVLGGSEGGTPDAIARRFAGAGYVTLALAYFDEPDLPPDLHSIALEYFARGLRWLDDRREGSAEPPAVWGVSRGGEAALLIAATYPDLVSGVVAAVPADVVVCGYPDNGRPSWTLHGKPLPCTQDTGPPSGYLGTRSPGAAASDGRATIPVGRIDDPLLLTCGGEDITWPSCPMARDVMHRVDASTTPPPHHLRAYPDAGHHVGVPPQVQVSNRGGGLPEANEEARASAWDATLQFLDQLPE